MSMINKGIPYFPTPANFFDEEIMELWRTRQTLWSRPCRC